jgi:hypothetical protein
MQGIRRIDLGERARAAAERATHICIGNARRVTRWSRCPACRALRNCRRRLRDARGGRRAGLGSGRRRCRFTPEAVAPTGGSLTQEWVASGRVRGDVCSPGRAGVCISRGRALPTRSSMREAVTSVVWGVIRTHESRMVAADGSHSTGLPKRSGRAAGRTPRRYREARPSWRRDYPREPSSGGSWSRLVMSSF